MNIVERISEIKRARPLESVRVLVPNRGTGANLHRELCSELGSFAAVEIVPVGEFLKQSFEPDGRRLLTDTQRIIAIMKALEDAALKDEAPQLFALRENFALIAKLNTTFKQLECLASEDVDGLLASPDVSATFAQALRVFRRARALYAAEYYEQGEVYRVAPAPSDEIGVNASTSTLFTYNLDFAPKNRCIRGVLDNLVPPENRYNDTTTTDKTPAVVTKLSDPETECIWAVQQVIAALHDEALKPADIAITYCTDRGYSTALKLYLDEAHIANRLQTRLSLSGSTLFKRLVAELLEAHADADANADGNDNVSLAPLTPDANTLPLQRTVYVRYNDLLANLEQFTQAGIALTPAQLHEFITTYYLSQSIALEPQDAGEISVVPIGDLYGRAFKLLIVLGLSETIAPATFKQDSIINFSDIKLLQALTDKDPLPTLSQHIDLQESQFKVLVEKGGTVRLSVPAQTSKGTELIESRWLADCITFDEAVLEKVPASRMTLIKAEGAAHAGTDVLSPRYFETIHNLQDEIVTANRQLSESRSRYKFDKYNGKIEHPGLKDFFEHWSASGFELYAKNPFDFFMKNILGLKEPGLDATAEAFSELDAMDFGTFMHACLENLTNLFVQQGSLDETDIDNTLQEVLVNVPVDHEDWQEKYPELLALLQAGKVDEAITQQLSNQIQDAREKLIKWSAYFQEEIEGYKVYTETAFTTKKGTGKELSMLDGTSIMLDGRIDRTDVNSATNLKRVVDYKTGKPHDIDPNDLTAGGRKFQLQLYALLASEEPDFSDIEKAEYQYFRCEDPPQARTATQEALAASRELTLAYLTAMRACIESGIFPYKGAKYGSPFMTLALDQESDRNRLSRFLHNPYKHELEKIKMSADQSTREKVIAGLSAYEGEGY